ncbi:phage portal protein [Escherichia coli]|nr:phage portal protein [Escherichia coli]
MYFADIPGYRQNAAASYADGCAGDTQGNAPGGYCPSLSSSQRQQNRIQFFELWLNAKLRHGNTVVLKIRNPGGRSKNCVFWTGAGLNLWWRMTARCSIASPDRNCGITEAVTVPAREVIHDRFNCFFHPLMGAAGVCCRAGGHAGASYSGKFTSFFRNGGRPSGVIEIPGSITEENAKKLKSNWDSGYTGENAGKTAILSNGANITPRRFHRWMRRRWNS